MKLLLVVLSAFIGAKALDEEFLTSARERVKHVVQDCVTEEKASQKDFEDIMGLKKPETHEAKCVYFCAHKKFNIQHDDGGLNKIGAMETFEIIKDLDEAFHGKLIEAFEHCMNIPRDPDNCEYSFTFFKCTLEESTKGGVNELIIK